MADPDFGFRIGRAGARAVMLDAFMLTDSRLLECANSGGGKSYALRCLVERVGKTLPVIVIDPEGEFSTLRQKLDMILVGPDGDLAAEPRFASMLCRKMIELRLSGVIDLSELKPRDRRLYVKDFLETLIGLPRALWSPTLIVIDEAHDFCSERSDNESTAAVISLMSQGRKRGFGACLATQRLAKLHKDAVGECNNVLIGRCVQDIDLKRAADILGLTAASARQQLQALKPGEFFGFGPAFDHVGVLQFKIDKVETDHPDARNRHAIRPPAPSKAIVKALAELADIPAQAQAEVSTVDALKAKVATLTDELRQARSHGSIQANERATGIAVNAAIQAHDEAWRRAGEIMIARILDGVEAEVSAASRDFGPFGSRIRDLPAVAKTVAAKREPAQPKTPQPKAPRPKPVGDSSLSPSAIKVLSALATFDDGLDLKKIGIITGLATKGGSFSTSMASLRAGGYIEGSGTLRITGRGLTVVGEPEELPTGRALLSFWHAKLKNRSASAILDALVEDSPMTVQEIGRVTGLVPRGGSFSTAMKRLRAMDLIRGKGKAAVAVNPDLLERLRTR